MEEKREGTLDQFLESNGFQPNKLTTQEKYKILKEIYNRIGVDLDFEEMKRTRKMISADEYLSKIKNLLVYQYNIQGYLYELSRTKKLERKKEIKRLFKRLAKK